MVARMEQQQFFAHAYPGAFPSDHSGFHLGGHLMAQDHGGAQQLQERLQAQEREIAQLTGTVTHYRTWASQLQARYQMFNPDATRPAKRVYIGNLPQNVNEAELRQAVNELMVQCSGTAGPGFPIASCKLYPCLLKSPPGQPSYDPEGAWPHGRPSADPSAAAAAAQAAAAQAYAPPPLRHPAVMTPVPMPLAWGGPPPGPGPAPRPLHATPSSSSLSLSLPPDAVQDKSYAFVEFRSVEEASNCMALDGARFKDTFLKIRRPNNYDANLAIMLGPTEANPAMQLAGVEVVRTVVHDSPHKLFIGGLPCDWNEEQVKEMLLPYGALKAFNLVMDRSTGNSKGYAFCEFQSIATTDSIIQSLNGKPVGNKFLTVKRALSPAPF